MAHCMLLIVSVDVTFHILQGSLESGQVFDSSKDKNPIPFVLGEGRVIQGTLNKRILNAVIILIIVILPKY